jgi:hypothetical protein
MKTHDIICEAEGWAYHVNGVRQRIFPTWFMALNAARGAAEQDIRRGIAATFRCQGADGALTPVQSGAASAKESAVLRGTGLSQKPRRDLHPVEAGKTPERVTA